MSLETEIRRRVATWRELMGRHAVQAQEILRKILVGPIVFTPADVGGEAGYRFNGERRSFDYWRGSAIFRNALLTCRFQPAPKR